MNRKHILVTVLLLALLLGQVCAFPVFAEQAPAVEYGLPVLYVNVDETAEGFGTVAEMNESPFRDVAVDSWYADAVLWAAETGVTLGTTPTTFSPDLTCTRAQAVTFLHRMQPQR